MMGFNMNGKSANARLDFIRKETDKVKGQVQRTDMYRQLRPIQLEACFGTCVKVIALSLTRHPIQKKLRETQARRREILEFSVLLERPAHKNFSISVI